MMIIRYLVLKYTSELPLFDERFVNYGYNKVQYVDHLRLRGYEFYILKGRNIRKKKEMKLEMLESGFIFFYA